MAGMGWSAATIVRGLAGGIASSLMNSSTGLLMNIVLGIVGPAILTGIAQAVEG